MANLDNVFTAVWTAEQDGIIRWNNPTTSPTSMLPNSYTIPFHIHYLDYCCCFLFMFSLVFLLFGHFCMFCIFRYLCVTVYIQLFSFRAASVCLINSVVSWNCTLFTIAKITYVNSLRTLIGMYAVSHRKKTPNSCSCPYRIKKMRFFFTGNICLTTQSA